jgi:hypothetical protein
MFIEQMQEHGRFLMWKELQPRLQNGQGTLIIEFSISDSNRVWWTPHDIRREAPVQPITIRRLDDVLDLLCQEPHPFVTWCFEEYLHPVFGKAFLTKPLYCHLGGFEKITFFRCMFPNLSVVMTLRNNKVKGTA